LLEKKNEENRKSYEEVLKGRNHGQLESKKTIKDTYSRRPSMFKPQRSFNHDNDQSRKKFKGLRHKEDHSLPGMQISFMVIVFTVLTLDIRLQIPGIIKEMFKQ
jgi:hypothetical protein